MADIETVAETEEIITEDWNGKPVVRPGVETVDFYTTAGNKRRFTRGVAVSKTVEPDFSGGDMTVPIGEDEAVKELTIKKPENLVPGNIVKDVEIGGVVGTHEGGGGSLDENLKYFKCHIDPAAGIITLYEIFYDLIYADTGSYDVTIPDTIGGMPVVIAAE